MSEKPVLQRVTEIVTDATQIAKDEIQLTVAKIKPQATDAGLGAGLIGAAGVLALNTIPLFALLFVTLFSWLYSNWLGVFPSIVLGFLTEALMLLLLAAILGLVGYGKAKRIKEVKPTLEESKARLVATVDLAKGAVESGKQRVAELGTADRPELDRTAT
ncbi:MAG TPA: phage holin family protein [Propionibacteriaceae bacterium]|nr:phage holin family protein [Propionibacteriaceae bacterium]HPZ49180.1 phage holin family protein [Propionibacteriaceae bacterium]HQE32548.1 phage holin family protein [Propionibacteriaceae bacterium]